MHDSMHRNSSLLILSQAVNAGCGFLFWIINAHLFSSAYLGFATAFISFSMLAATFTNLGLPNTVIRFLPTANRRGGLFTASLILVMVSSLMGGVIALLLTKPLLPKFAFIHSSPALSLIFILMVCGTAVSALLDSTVMAFRKGEYVLRKALITNLPRIILPFFVVAAGVEGMTGIYVATLLLGIGYNLFTVFRRLLKSERLLPTLAEVGKHRSYAASNYFGGVFGVLPVTLVPLVVLSVRGASAAAYFYMPMMIAAFLSVICSAVSQALISECSQTDDVAKHRVFLKKALSHEYQLLTPLVVLLLVLGWPILRLYGSAYAMNGYLPLVILLGSSLIVGINWLGDTWLNIKKRSRDYFVMNAFNAFAVVAFVYVFAPHGLVAAAFGWLCGQLLSAVVYLTIFARGQRVLVADRFKTFS